MLGGFLIAALSALSAYRSPALGAPSAVPTPSPAVAAAAGRPSVPTHTRRSALLGAAVAVLPSVVAPMSALAKDKGYMTMDEYKNMQQKQKKDEELYGYFATLRSRSAQTGEFEALASKGDFSGVTKLALAWDSTIRQEVLDRAAKELTGADQKTASSLSKSVLDDLKQLDKLAKAKAGAEEIASTAAALKGHVNDFVALEPQRLADRFGISDL